MPRLSVIIITKNEEHDLPACLQSVSFADEVVVVDSGSTDRTVEIATAAGARVVHNPWPGFAAQKALALAQAAGDWVLSLDADERCSPALRQAIPGALQDESVDGYSIAFETWMFGRRARFGGLRGERHLRLFRREKASFPERAVHEGAQVPGPVGFLPTPIVHHTYASLDEYVDKINRYTSAAAQDRYRRGKRFSGLCVLRLPWGFFRRYLLQLGFLDGYDGFIFAALGGLYDLLKYAKLRDLESTTRQADG